jgi:rare lipoprotein A
MTPSLVKTLAQGLAILAVAGLAACAGGGVRYQSAGPYKSSSLRPYEAGGKRYEPHVYSHYDEVGMASWYSYPSGTRRTATGEWFDAGKLTAAHKTLPLPCTVEVTNLENGRSIRVRVNDRGPFVSGRIIDLSRAAADRLGFTHQGAVKVRVKLLGPAPVADSGEIEMAVVDTPPAAAAPAP